MIKRRFYKLEHGDRDGPSDSSSSSSDSELEAVATDETEEQEEEDYVVEEVRQKDESSSSSGYESEDSSTNEVDLDPSGLPTNADDIVTENDRQNNWERCSSGKCNTETVKMQCDTFAEADGISSNAAGYVLRCKSVFKCRLCPRIVCLTEETLQAHLKSKRHARSEKLLCEGRLKLMLNSDGEIEGDAHPEKRAPIVTAGQDLSDSRKNKWWKRWGKRLKNKKMGGDSTLENARKPTKKRRKGDN